MTALALLALAAAAAPLTLEDALALAARRNPELELARAAVAAAGADVRLAYAGVLPNLGLAGSFGARRVRANGATDDGGLHAIELDLTQPLFNGLANWNTIGAARSTAAAAERQLDEALLRVSFGVTRAFYEVVKQRHALDVRRDTAKLSADLVARADALFGAGRGTRADTYSARANLGNDELAVHQQQAALEAARAQLAAAIGLPSSAGLEIVPPFPLTGPGAPAPAEEPPPLAGLLAQARKDRPLVASLRLAGEAADAGVAVAQGAWWPVVGLLGTLRREATDVSGDNGIFAGPSKLYTATGQVTLTWNLFGGGATAAGVARARAESSRAQAALAQGEQLVAAEVEVAREQVVTLGRSLASLRPLVEASENALRFARELLEVGRSSQLEVRDASLKVEQARLAWVNTTADLAVARADLARATGARR